LVAVGEEIGHGAPNDGLGLNQMHGWAIGSLNTEGPLFFFVDDVAVYERQVVIDDFESGLPEGTDGDGIPVGFLTFRGASSISIATTDTPPATVPAATGANNVYAGDAQPVIDLLVAIDEAFAHAAIDRAIDADGDDARIRVAQRLADLADRQAGRGNYHTAIWLYGRSWRFATSAV
jgi:hypothetical protein